MNLTIPRFALLVAERRGLTAVLVRSRRGQVAHLVQGAAGTRLLTGTDRLRRGVRPVCGTRGRGFRQLHVPETRLCAYCTAHTLRDSNQRDWQHLGTLDFLWALRHARCRMELQVAVKAMRESGLQFRPYPLPDGSGDVSLMYVLHHSRAWQEYAA